MTTIQDLSAEEILCVADRELGLRSFYDFVCVAWEHIPGEVSYTPNKLHTIMCDALEKVGTGEIRNLLINIPPGFGKSIIVGVLWPIWHWIKHQKYHDDFLFTSFDIELMWRDSERCSTLIDDPWFAKRWGNLLRRKGDSGVGGYKKPQGVQQKIGAWSTHKNGMRVSASVGGKITGKHPDILVIDDPTKPIDATPAELQRSRTWYSSTVANRGKDKRTIRRVCVMQRISDEDLSDLLESIGWHVLRLPFVYDSRSVSPYDWRTEDGTCLDPVRYPPHVVEEIKRDAQAAAGVWDTQWQQNPTPPGGVIYKTEWFRYYDPRTLPPLESFDDSCLSWDLTFKGKATSDWVVGQAWGRIGMTYYLLGRVSGKWNYVESKREFAALCFRFPWIAAKLVEDKANGPALEADMKDDFHGIIMRDPGTKDKVQRAMPITPLFEAGNVEFPYGAPFLDDYINQLKRFPKAKYDDDVDATNQGLLYLRDRNKGSSRYDGMKKYTTDR